MRLVVKQVGSGERGDLFRAPFPTYSEVEYDPDAGTFVIDIPDEDFPPEMRRLLDLHQHLDKRYKEHEGLFRPKLVEWPK